MNPNRQLDLALALAAVGLAFLGQFLFREDQATYTTGLLYFLGAALMLLLLVRRREPAEVLNLPGPPTRLWTARLRSWLLARPISMVLIGLGAAMSYVVAGLMVDPIGLTNYTHVFLLWILSMLLVLAGAFEHVPRLPDLRGLLARRRPEVLVVAGLTILAGLLRFVALGAVPDIVSGDEGNVGWIALAVQNGDIKNMFSTTFGHSMLYLYGIASGMNVFGTGPLGLRFTSALIGTLNIPLLFILARRMFNSRVAVVAAGLLAVSHIHVHFSRIIVAGSIQDAFWATIIFYFFYTGLQTRSTLRMVLSALALGIHFHIYMGGRLIILLMPVLVLFIVVLAKGGRSLVRANLGNLVYFAIALVVSAMPLTIWGFNHWPDFMARGNQVGILQTGWLAQEVTKTGQPEWQIFGRLLLDALLTINHFPANGFYLSKYPMLDFVGGALFMLGLAYALYRMRDVRFLILHGWMWSAIVVGGALVTQAALGAYRILIILPVVCILVGVAVDRLLALAVDRSPSPLGDPVEAVEASKVGVAQGEDETWEDEAARPRSDDATGKAAGDGAEDDELEVAGARAMDERDGVRGGEVQADKAGGGSWVSRMRAGRGTGRRASRITAASTILLAAVLLAMGALNFKAYFLDYAFDCAYEDWGTRFASFMGGYLRDAGPEYKAYLFGAPRIFYGPHKSVDYLKENNIPVTNVDLPITAAPAFARPDEKSIYFFISDRQAELAFIENALPGGTKTEKRDCGQLMMVVYRYDGLKPSALR